MKNKMYKRIAISEIGSIVSGATPKTSDAANYGGDIPWLTPADLSGYTNKYIERGARNISKKGYDSCSTQIMPAGSILFSSRAPIGYVAIAANPICTNQGFKSIVPNKNVDSEFLFYQLKFLKNQIADLGRGTTFKEISGKTLGSVEIVLPDLKEQKRIVNKIEELFSELDSAVETLKKTKEQLAVYRQSVLKEAFENVEASQVRLDDLCDFITKGTTPSKSEMNTETSSIPFIKVYNLTFDLSLDFSIDPTFVNENTHNTFLARSKVLPGDVLMNIVGPPMGKVSIVPETYPEWNMNQAIARFRCEDNLNNRYLAYFLGCKQTVEKMMRQSKATAGQFNLTLEICRNIQIPLPSIKEQKAIVSVLDKRLSVCKGIEKTVNDALAQAEAMRQSILKKAFEGGL